MTNTHLSENEPRPRGAGVAARDFASSLRSLLEIAKAVRSGADVDSVLDAIARVVGETLGFQTVVLNVYRPSGTTSTSRPSTAMTRFAMRCSARSTTGGAGRRSWTTDSRARARTSSRTTRSTGRRTTAIGSYPPASPLVEGPEGWHPNDELFVPLKDSTGEIVGIMSFGDPLDGRRPDDEQLANAVALASHAALALEAAQERARSQRHQSGLEQLLHVTSQLPQTVSTEAMLRSVCEAVSEALGFDKVLIQLVADGTGRLTPAAPAGFSCRRGRGGGTQPRASDLSAASSPKFEHRGLLPAPREEAASASAQPVVYAP
jgi:GAF domain-containing protein